NSVMLLLFKYFFTNSAKAGLVKKYLNSNNITELTGAALETLAIIAYKQPITRIGVDEIRGVQSSSMIQRLQLLELIKENGRLDAPGRPILYVTTDKFLDYFGLESLDQLPELDEEKQEDEEMDLMTLFEQTTGSKEDEEEE
ncbi:SMC-Scp complex subunit ScpB, partial [Lactobacillus salivarius]|nr:SMC-Scp complex subunit ScpB [Ligilactobacillus salivarius]